MDSGTHAVLLIPDFPVLKIFGCLPVPHLKKLFRRENRGRRVFMSMQRGAAMGVRDWFGGEYQKLDVYAGYNLLYNAAMLVDCCMGAAVCIEGATSLYKNPDLVFIPFYPELSVSAVLVWKKYQPLPAAVERFVEFIRQKVKDAAVG